MVTRAITQFRAGLGDAGVSLLHGVEQGLGPVVVHEAHLDAGHGQAVQEEVLGRLFRHLGGEGEGQQGQRHGARHVQLLFFLKAASTCFSMSL